MSRSMMYRLKAMSFSFWVDQFDSGSVGAGSLSGTPVSVCMNAIRPSRGSSGDASDAGNQFSPPGKRGRKREGHRFSPVEAGRTIM
jgi:hypothetical protein